MDTINISLTEINENIYKKFSQEMLTPTQRFSTTNFLKIQQYETQNLEKTQDFLKGELEDMQTLHQQSKERSKRSLIPIVRKAFSFLFGILDEDYVRSIRVNARRLRDRATYM